MEKIDGPLFRSCDWCVIYGPQTISKESHGTQFMSSIIPIVKGYPESNFLLLNNFAAESSNLNNFFITFFI